MERVDWNVAIFTCCQGDISVRILRTMQYPGAAAHTGLSQTYKMDVFARTVNSFKLKLLTVFAKSCIICLEGSWIN